MHHGHFSKMAKEFNSLCSLIRSYQGPTRVASKRSLGAPTSSLLSGVLYYDKSHVDDACMYDA